MRFQGVGYLKAVKGALDAFSEAMREIQRDRDLLPLELEFEVLIALAFARQGERFLGYLDQLRLPPQDPAPLGEAIWAPLFNMAALETSYLFSAPVTSVGGRALSLGATRAAGEMGLGLSFDLPNPRAVAWLEAHGAELVTRVNDTTRRQIRDILVAGTREGQSYDQMAKAISDRFTEFAVGRPQLHIDSRAHLVAVTEVGNAYQEGNFQVGQMMAEAGLEMEKSWLTMGDQRVSDGCRANAAVGWIPLDQPFPSGHLRPLRFPGCRCDLLIRQKGA